MPEVLNIATSGLLTLQRALSTTSNNIVNVNTEGYSRQSVSFETQQSRQTGAGFIGSGVTSSPVERVYNAYLVDQVHLHTASESSLSTMSDMVSRLDNVLADPAGGLNQNIQKFFSAVNSMANNPASSPERRVVIAEAEALATQVKYLDNSLDQLNTEINNRMVNLTNEITEIANNIAHINERIVFVSDSSANILPNDLMDQRDLLITRLASKVGVSTVETNDGAVNVFIGTGQPLVVGSDVNALSTAKNEFDGRRLEVVYASDGSNADITSLITGGELKGLLNFRDQVLDETRNQLGVLVVGLGESINEQHRLGLDLDGNFGQDFFKPAEVGVVADPDNAGAAVIDVTISDYTDIEATDYQLRYDGSQWLMLRKSDSSVTTSAGSFTLDGMDISITGGAPQAGDTYLIRPTYGGAAAFEVQLSRPGDIAAAAPLRSESNDANLGDAALSVSADISSAIAGDITVSFDPDAMGPGVPGYTVSGAVTATIAYDPVADASGVDVALAGVGTLHLSGNPEAGDSFTIANNLTATGDNTNALALADMQELRVLENGKSSFQSFYGNIVADVGVKARQAEVNASTETTLLQQAQTARASVSGVNLDEEAANLLKFQQAYQAAARVVSVADSMFQTLLSATRR